MKRFFCRCGQELFFENSQCYACGRTIGFDPAVFDMVPEDDGHGQSRRACANRRRYEVCNWWVTDTTGLELCRSCRLNVVIPNLDQPENLERWAKLEQAKRRLLYTLIDLELSFEGSIAGGSSLAFFFLEDQRTNEAVAPEMVLTGYAGGRITILAAEADDLFRESQRTSMAQRYRTLLGHMRHESGHFFWETLVRDGGRTGEFRELFGDERIDYKESLERFYLDSSGEHPNFISPYARAHPLEDWAETWSHALHVFDTVETAIERGLLPSDSRPQLRSIDDALLDRFAELAVSLNELNRSLGLADAYPFVLGESVRAKLRFIGSVVSSAAVPT